MPQRQVVVVAFDRGVDIAALDTQIADLSLDVHACLDVSELDPLSPQQSYLNE
jgi:hypothetical protein